MLPLLTILLIATGFQMIYYGFVNRLAPPGLQHSLPAKFSVWFVFMLCGLAVVNITLPQLGIFSPHSRGAFLSFYFIISALLPLNVWRFFQLFGSNEDS